MQKYICSLCNYESNDKSNFRKHKKSTKHATLNDQLSKLDIDDSKMDKELPPKFNCKCGKVFKYASGLSKHKKKCDKIEMINILEAKADKINKLETKVKQMEKKLNETTKQANNNNNTINVSVKNYIQQNYSDAPHLIQLSDYSPLEKQYERKNEDEDDDEKCDLATILRYHYKNKQLHCYLGNFIIKNYKKNDPKKQSIWNSDIARLTYIIKELLANKKSCWIHDPKGIKTKNYIIDPLLNHVRYYCLTYLENNEFDKSKKNDIDYCHDTTDLLATLWNIAELIRRGELADDIIKYMAPFFHLNRDDDKLEYDAMKEGNNFLDDVIEIADV
jgi:hypothetical protein